MDNTPDQDVVDMHKKNIAVIGGGYISRYHIRALEKIPEVNIALSGTNHEKLSALMAEFNISEILTFEEILKRPDIDAVIIATPNKFHAPFANAALKMGKDVFLEKPMAMNTDECKIIQENAESNNRIVMVGHMWRFDEEVDQIKHLINSGAIGSIFKTKGYGIHQNWGPSGWFVSHQLAGGGALIDMGVHAIDTCRYLLGDPRPVSVYARIDTRFGKYDVDDNGILIINWSDDSTSIIESGWWHSYADGPEAATRIYGTKGYASLFPTEAKIQEGEELKSLKFTPINKSEHCDQKIYDHQMKYFVECMKTRSQPSPGIEEGMTVMKIVDAAYRSSLKNEVILIES
ncbi:MAG: Gfo/Idh/MocA family oxidoreductase [Saprospiraceae bacterium]|nr:Gfo/Idh/MocA family oxidoreductase [Saprospiraceae bacterium]